MGYDVLSVGNHRLNTNDIEQLASNLSVRLNANVKYGHLNNENTNDDHAFIELGQYGYSEVVYHLYDFYHFDRQREPSKFRDTICFEILLEKYYDEYSAFIYRDSFVANEYYSNRWWRFCRNFTGELEQWDYLEEFRKSVFKKCKRWVVI